MMVYVTKRRDCCLSHWKFLQVEKHCITDIESFTSHHTKSQQQPTTFLEAIFEPFRSHHRPKYHNYPSKSLHLTQQKPLNRSTSVPPSQSTLIKNPRTHSPAIELCVILQSPFHCATRGEIIAKIERGSRASAERDAIAGFTFNQTQNPNFSQLLVFASKRPFKQPLFSVEIKSFQVYAPPLPSLWSKTNQL